MTPPVTEKKFRSYVPDKTNMREFTFRAVLLGLVLTAVLGAANAYLGLKSGMTIAATYPAAVIGMALLKLMKGSLLEENMARTIGSIGESVAAGAVFTIPAFVLSGLWPGLTGDKYWNSVVLRTHYRLRSVRQKKGVSEVALRDLVSLRSPHCYRKNRENH